MAGLLIPDVNNPNKWKHRCVYDSRAEWEENFKSFRLDPKAQESTECGVLKIKYKCVHWRSKCQYQVCVMMDEKVGICQVFEILRAHNHPFDQAVADNSMPSKLEGSLTRDDLSTSADEDSSPTLLSVEPAGGSHALDVASDNRLSSSVVEKLLEDEEEREEAGGSGNRLGEASTTASAPSGATSDEDSPTKRKRDDIAALVNDSALKKRKIGRLEFFLDESLTSDPLDTEKFVMEYRARDGHTFWVAARFMHHLKMPPPSERESFQIAEMRDEIESLADEFDYSAFQLRSALLLLLLDNEVESNIVYFTPPGLRPITGAFLRFFDKGDVVEICEHLDGHFRQNFFWPKSTVANFRSMARRLLKSFLDE